MMNSQSCSIISFIVLLFSINSLWAEASHHYPPLLWNNSPYTFTQSEITAAPGDVIQICVDRQTSGIQLGTTSVVVQIAGSSDPHLSNFPGKTLYFPFGVNQACFDLVLETTNSRSSYRLVIAESGDRMVLDVKPDGNLGRCGAIPPTRIGHLSTGIAGEDHFGNPYSHECPHDCVCHCAGIFICFHCLPRLQVHSTDF